MHFILLYSYKIWHLNCSLLIDIERKLLRYDIIKSTWLQDLAFKLFLTHEEATKTMVDFDSLMFI
jgi:hypothetical protein